MIIYRAFFQRQIRFFRQIQTKLLLIIGLKTLAERLRKDRYLGSLSFFNGGENQNFRANLNALGLSQENSDFLDYLTSEDCRDVLERDNIFIHVESGESKTLGKASMIFCLISRIETKKSCSLISVTMTTILIT